MNTTWKFKEMIAFRDHWVKEFDLDLIEMTNHDAIAKGVNPYDYAPSIYTDIMKTVPLKAGLDQYGFDGGQEFPPPPGTEFGSGRRRPDPGDPGDPGDPARSAPGSGRGHAASRRHGGQQHTE
mgnify:CR=1 FL=1